MKRALITLVSLLVVAAVFGTGGCAKNNTTAANKASEKPVAVPVVKGFPADFPLIDGGVVTSSMTYNSVGNKEGEGQPTGVSYYTQVKTTKTVDEVIRFYKSKFSSIKQEAKPKKGTTLITGFINKYPTSIYFTEKDSQTLLTIIISKKNS
ncbi:MAG TPA: hypothetical protein VGK02_05840 [Candidatus Aquicultor sp.]|jgi:hypothetical protein